MKLSKLKSCTVILQGFQPLNLLMTLFLTQIEFPQEWIYVKTQQGVILLFSMGFFCNTCRALLKLTKKFNKWL